MVEELKFKDGVDSVPLYIDNRSAIGVVGSRTYFLKAKQIAMR